MKKQIILIFTFSIFIFGTASAQQQQSYESVPNQSNSNEKKTNLLKEKTVLTRISVNDKFSAGEIITSADFGKGFSFSVGLGTNFSFNPYVLSSYYGVTYVYPLNDKINLWASAGYQFILMGDTEFSTPYGTQTIEGASGGAITWQVGADFFINEKFGITAYSYEVKTLNIGIVFRKRR